MMERLKSCVGFLAAFGCCLLGTTACVNQIVTEDGGGGKIPITFSLSIDGASTRVADNAFETSDEIGLFAMLTGTEMDEERYIDNLLLTCTDEDELMSDEVVYYPEGDETLDFIAYYPYSSAGVEAGSSVLPVSIQTNQSDAEGRSLSDFMTASKSRVAGSEKAVELVFNHQLVKLKVSLIAGENTDLDEMLEDNPHILATGFYTKAEYDLATGSFRNFSEIADINSACEWERKGDKLEGYELIVLPQEMDGTQVFQMEWNGRIYTCPFPKISELESNMQYELEINSSKEESYIMTGMIVSINDWQDEEVLDQTENEAENERLLLSMLDFDKSNVYRVYQGGKAVAEICKEYLASDDLTSQAITIYPVNDAGEADLQDGKVLQLLDTEENVNGGALAWDEADNTFTYTPGNLPDVQDIYFDADGQVLFEKPANPAAFGIKVEMLGDWRGELRDYPIVKIGTQYWMRENLKTDKYKDGTAIPDEGEEIPGYLDVIKSGSHAYFYSREALTANEISPGGWRLPTVDDWKALEEYVDGNAWLLKGGAWKTAADGQDFNKLVDVETPADANKAMMYIYPSGGWYAGGHQYAYAITSFWAWDYAIDSIASQAVFFMSGNTFVWEGTKDEGGPAYKGMSIRCIKE